jgi:hypothetical protein
MTKTVFLDTHVFDTHVFDFDSPLLENFRSFASTGLINVVTTEVTCGEIEARITEKVQNSLHSLKAWLKERDSRILRHVGDRFAVLFSKAKAEDCAAVLKQQFRDFLDATHTVVLPTGTIDGTQLVEAYFGAVAPFGPGRKKAQFPDAIAVAVLRQWCEENDCTVEVVSGDLDWKRACDGCKCLNHTEELKDLLTGIGIVPPAVTDALVQMALTNRGLPGVIAERFKDALFYTLPGEGTVDETDNVEVAVNGHTMVYAPDGPSTIEVMCRITFRARVVYDLPESADPSTVDWDTFHPATNTFHEWVKLTVDRSAEVGIAHDGKNPNSVQIVNVQFDDFAIPVNWSGPSGPR